jgi:L-arabinose transport system substrate-binding protein
MFRKFALPLALAGLVMIGCGGGSSTDGSSSTTSSGNKAASTDKVKIGFLVKSATEQWFQTEWKFGEEAAKKYNVELIEKEVVDGEKVSSALDDLKVQGAQGVIICTPDQKLGPMIAKKAADGNMKLLTVDDRLVGADGQPMKDVHHLGIQAYDIGKTVGQAISDEMKKRGWKPSEVGAIAISSKTAETLVQRIKGASDVLTANGFPAANIYEAVWKVADTNGAIDATNIILTQHPDVKKWVIFSSNDDGVLGGVRATETHKIAAENVIGVGINGNDPAIADLKKTPPTGFFATVLLSAKKHGYGTVEAIYHWIKDGQEPPMETWTSGILMDRTNYEQTLKEQGL